MRQLPTPATVVEQYLAAVLEELRATRVLLEDRLPGKPAPGIPDFIPADEPPAAVTPPTKRTRTRTREGASRA